MLKLRLWLLTLCIITICLDKYSVISQFRDNISIYIQQKTNSIINKIHDYPKLVFLQKNTQNTLEKENTQLKKQLEEYSVLLNQQKNLTEDSQNVDKLVNNASLYTNFTTIVAKAIIDINYLINNKLLINKGSKSNVSIGDAVVNQDGVIGQISITNKTSSQIKLITNPEFKIYVQTNRTKSKMLAQGIGNNSLIVKYIDKKSDLKIGDVLVTTGLDDIYPANIPVAKITKIFYENNGFNAAVCQPVVNFNNLQFVVVLKNATK